MDSPVWASRGWLLLCLLCLAGVLAGRPAPGHAQAPSAAQMRAAQQHYEDGATLYAAGHFEAAHEQFREAYRLSQLPDMLFNLSRSAEHMGQPLLALRYLEEYLRERPQDAERDKIRRDIDRLQELAGPHVADPGPQPALTAKVPVSPPAAVSGKTSRRKWLSVGKWVLGAAGILAVGAGAALWGVDGRQTCGVAAPYQCKLVLDTKGTGIGVLTTGLVLLGGSAVLFGLDYRQGRDERVAQLSVAGRF